MKNMILRKYGLVLAGLGCVIMVAVGLLLLFGSTTMGEIEPRTANAGITAAQSDLLENTKLYASSESANVVLVSTSSNSIAVETDTGAEPEVAATVEEETPAAEGYTISSDETVSEFLERVKNDEFVFDPSLDEDEDIMLEAGLAEAEAGGRTLTERVAVLATVHHRLDNSRFPNSVSGVIYAKNQYATPKTPTEASLKAAKAAYVLYQNGRLDEVLPSEYVYFFGWKNHNWFYNKDYQIYEGLVSLPGGVYDAMKEIVPEL